MTARLVRITVVLVLGTMLGACADEPSTGSGGSTTPSASATPTVTATPTATVTATPTATATVEVTIARRSGPLLEAGDTVPEFMAPALDGGEFTWSDYVGTPTVLAVWAPWCPHCQVELPRLSAAVQTHPALQLVSVATAIGAVEGPTPQEYMDAEGLTFPVALDDAQATLMQGLGVTSFPTVYYVDASGAVVAATTGELEPAALERILAQLEGVTP